MDDKLKQLMKELGEAINESLYESEPIAEVISKIKAGGYDVFLVLEATIGFNRRDDEATARSSPSSSRRNSEVEFRITPQDARFLKDLRISLEK